MDPANTENADNRETTNNHEQDGNSANNSKHFFERFLRSYLWIGARENDATHLVLVNTVYLLCLFWFVFITSLLHTPLVRNGIERELSNCRENQKGDAISNCGKQELIESIAVRIGFTLVMIFLSLALTSLVGHPEKIHQGFWLVKFLLVLIVLPTGFAIPIGLFDIVWGILSFLGSLVFYVIEAVLILDFATTVSDIFVFKITEERSKSCYLLWLVLIWVIYVVAVSSTFVLYAFYANDCNLSTILVTSTFILCTVFALITVYFSNRRTGFLHSGLATLFILLLTLVTLKQGGLCPGEGASTDMKSETKLSGEILKYLEIVLGFLLVAYAALRNFSGKYYHIRGLIVSQNLLPRKDSSMEEDSLKEADGPVFSPCAFFTMLVFYSFFVTTKWTSLRTGKDEEPLITHTITFHLRSLTVITILILMSWSQVFPIIYPRENPYDLWALGKTFLKSQLRLSRRILIDGCDRCNGPLASRYIFTILYVLGVFFSCLLYVPEIRHCLSKSTYFCSTISTRGVCLSTDPAYMAVYRVCFSMAMFFLLFAAILVCVDNTRDPRVDNSHDTSTGNTQGLCVGDTQSQRADITPRVYSTQDLCVENTRDPRVDLQYKAWPVKICLFCCLLLASFLLPNEFSRIWIYIALTGTFFFTILQLILLIYWTKSTRKKLQEKVQNSNSKFWPIVLASTTILMFLLSLAAIVTFYVFFTKFQRCLTNAFFITLNLIFVVATSLISVHPKIYDAGLFQCYVIVIFSLYLTWSGLSHNPDENCNPFAGYIAEVDMRPNLNIQAGLDLFFTFVTVIYFSSKVPEISETVRRATESLRNIYDRSRSTYDSSRNSETSAVVSVMETESQTKQYSQEYNFTLFHGVYFLASLHATIILTNWFIPTTQSRFKLSVNWAAMCVKMTASNLSLVIYVWSIGAQLLTK